MSPVIYIWIYLILIILLHISDHIKASSNTIIRAIVQETSKCILIQGHQVLYQSSSCIATDPVYIEFFKSLVAAHYSVKTNFLLRM